MNTCSLKASRWCRLLHLHLLLLVMLIAGSSGCRTAPPMAELVEPHLLQVSDEQREARAQRAAVPLEERIAAVEADIQEALVPVGDGVLAPHFLRQDGRRGPLHVEINAALLSALAAKYAATGDESAKALGEQIIRGILELDRRSGELDGLVAFELNPRTLEPSERTTHSNVYTQLLFAYVMADRHFGPSEDIRRHVSLIYQRFLADGFRMRQMDGTFTSLADVSAFIVSFNARRAYDRRLLDAAAYQLGDEETRELARRHQWRGLLLGPKHINFLGIEFPTSSSSWLNLQALTGLSMLDYGFERQAISLARQYRRDNNPFFRLLAAMNGAEENLGEIRSRLAEFPYPTTTSGIINSHRDELRVVRGNFVKLGAHPETRRVLPLYEIGSSHNLWKQRLRRIDTMPVENPQVLLGYDLYQAYWFLRMLEAQASG